MIQRKYHASNGHTMRDEDERQLPSIWSPKTSGVGDERLPNPLRDPLRLPSVPFFIKNLVLWRFTKLLTVTVVSSVHKKMTSDSVSILSTRYRHRSNLFILWWSASNWRTTGTVLLRLMDLARLTPFILGYQDNFLRLLCFFLDTFSHSLILFSGATAVLGHPDLAVLIKVAAPQELPDRIRAPYLRSIAVYFALARPTMAILSSCVQILAMAF